MFLQSITNLFRTKPVSLEIWAQSNANKTSADMIIADRINALLRHYRPTHGITCEWYNTKHCLNVLDMFAGIDTQSEQTGARVARHEQLLIMSTAPPAPEKRRPYFWLGAEAETI